MLILFLWGPEKLPKLARSVGQAKKEFEKASKGLEEEVRQLERDIRAPSSPQPAAPPSQPSAHTSADDKLLEVARSLGIETEGKTRDEIAKEIIERTKKQGS